jgi:serine/threonine protein kinase
MIKIMKKRPSPLRSRSEDDEFDSSLPALSFEQSPPPQKEKFYLEKPARKYAKSISFDLVNENFEVSSFEDLFLISSSIIFLSHQKQCDLFPEIVSISNTKKRDTIQLRRSEKKMNKSHNHNSSFGSLLSRTSSLSSSFSSDSCDSSSSSPRSYNSSSSFDLWQDSLLPRGSLTLACHSMDMGPVGRVEAALFRNKYRVAIKKHDNRSEEKIQKELALLKYLGNYPTVLSCYGFVANGPSMQIVYELSPYGTLDEILRANKIQSFPLSLIIAWLSDLADAIQFLHSKGIVHGDIRTDNLLVFERMDVKLCNFSSAYAIAGPTAGGEGISSGTSSSSSSITGLSSSSPVATPKVVVAGADIGFQKDMMGFFLTSIHIFTSKSFEEVKKLFDGTSKLFREKKLEEFLLNRPFGELNTFQKLYNILLLAVDYSNYPKMKEISTQLFSVLVEYFDGDPREPLNEYYKKLQRFELLIKSHVDNLVPLPPRSRLRQKLFGSSTFVKYQQNYPVEAMMEITSNKVYDPRTKLAEWFIEEFHCSFVEAEELSTFFLRNGFACKEEIEKEGLSTVVRDLLQSKEVVSEFSHKLANHLYQKQ